MELLVVGGSWAAFRLFNAGLDRLVPPPPAQDNRWKWRNIWTSLVHSLFSGSGALLGFYLHPQMASDVVGTHSPGAHRLVGVSVDLGEPPRQLGIPDTVGEADVVPGNARRAPVPVSLACTHVTVGANNEVFSCFTQQIPLWGRGSIAAVPGQSQKFPLAIRAHQLLRSWLRNWISPPQNRAELSR
uniref:Uncharacterized protein n=1 Tax=Sphaerodactylus townsendi TaxID=933632 RepID=A0ACB8EDB7_9SAUR